MAWSSATDLWDSRAGSLGLLAPGTLTAALRSACLAWGAGREQPPATGSGALLQADFSPGW